MTMGFTMEMMSFTTETPKSYRDRKLSELSDEDIIMGMVRAYKNEICKANHVGYIDGWSEGDECRYFYYPTGGVDHYNMRWFKEWCQNNRPSILKRLYGLKVFW